MKTALEVNRNGPSQVCKISRARHYRVNSDVVDTSLILSPPTPYPPKTKVEETDAQLIFVYLCQDC